MPLLSSFRTTHERCFGSGKATKFRRLAGSSTSAERLAFSLFSDLLTVKLKKSCSACPAARLNQK